MANHDSKTTWAGAILGAIVAFGQPVLDVISQAPHVGFSWKNTLIGIGVAILGKLSAGTKKE